MRRLLTFLTAFVLVVGSLAIGVFTADLPFWQRALQLPLPGDSIYSPVARIGVAAPADDTTVRFAGTTLAPVPPSESLELAARQARNSGSRALLVLRGDELVVSRYFGADDEHSLLPAGVIARPVAAMVAGLALADGRVPSLDTPVSPWLGEWEDEPRGRITLRQLLEETSGLEPGDDTQRLLWRSPWDDLGNLPRFGTSRGVRLWLGNDFANTALAFTLEHEPGGFYHRSPANPQLVALLLERATHQPYERLVDDRLWRPLGGSEAELALDRRAGMPAAHCCWRATAPDMVRLLSLLSNDGEFRGKRILPPGWTSEMERASRVSVESGLLLMRTHPAGMAAVAGAQDGSAFWAIPGPRITILNIVNPEGSTPPNLAALLLQGLGVAAAN